MQSLKKFVQPYRFSNRPYQSLPQIFLALALATTSVVGVLTLNGWLIVPCIMMVLVLELSAYPQEKHWNENAKSE